MRKFLSVWLVSLLVFSFTACGSGKNSQGSGEESTEIPVQESTEKDEADFSQEEAALEAGQTLEPENKGKNQAAGNILIVYFSRWGNTDYPEDVDAATSASIVVDGDGRYGTTEYIANMIADEVGGDLHLIETVTPYTTDFDELRNINHDEMDQNYLPELKESALDIAGYDTALAEEIKAYFPLTISMSGYGGREYYGGVDFYPENLEGGQKNFENLDSRKEITFSLAQ